MFYKKPLAKQHNLFRMKPIFNKLVDQAVGKPCDTTLEKLLAFKKSLMSFETR